MQFTAQQIGILLNGIVDGDPDVTVDQLAKIEEATQGSLSFLANKKYEQYLYQTKASIVIVGEDFAPTAPYTSTLIRVKDAYSAFSILLEQYNTLKRDKSGIEQPSYIHPTATLGKNVYVGAFAYIGANAVIGDNTKIYPQVYVGDNVEIGHNSTFFPGVKVYYDCKIGNNVTIHSSTVVGSDGFGFAPLANGTYAKVSQIGNVIIEDDVEIGSNSSIDRATLGSTIIRKGVKLDNLVQLAHNVDIGANTVMASQSGVSGSTKVGENCVIGGQVGIAGHISLAKGTQVQGKSGISRSTDEEGKKWAGIPAISYSQHMRAQVVLNRLPELERKLEELERKLQQKDTD